MDKTAPSSLRRTRRSFTTASLGMSILALTLVGGCGLEPVGTDLSACVTQPCSSAGGAGGTAVGTTGGAGPLASGGNSPGVGGTGAGGIVSSAGGNASTGGSVNGGGGITGSGGAPQEPCTDVPPPDDIHDWDGATCEMWTTQAESNPCSDEWFAGYCDESCGRCTATGSGGSGNGSGGAGSGGGQNGTGGTDLGDDNPWGDVTGGQQGWASRYWDCCKQSCGWSANAGGNPVNSCGGNGDNVVGENEASACDNGSATTCNSFAPWVYSNKVSFGFAATHPGQGTCGTCYHVQFTGTGHSGNDPGSQALAGKVMIVMAANIGGDVSGNQLDLLIPGGGIGIANGGQLGYGCDSAWGVSSPTDPALGAQYGGLRSGCSGDLNAVKNCLADKCETLFGSRGHTEMYDGCMWHATWFEAADNPNFTYKEVACPQELVQVSGR